MEYELVTGDKKRESMQNAKTSSEYLTTGSVRAIMCRSLTVSTPNCVDVPFGTHPADCEAGWLAGWRR